MFANVFLKVDMPQDDTRVRPLCKNVLLGTCLRNDAMIKTKRTPLQDTFTCSALAIYLAHSGYSRSVAVNARKPGSEVVGGWLGGNRV